MCAMFQIQIPVDVHGSLLSAEVPPPLAEHLATLKQLQGYITDGVLARGSAKFKKEKAKESSSSAALVPVDLSWLVGRLSDSFCEAVKEYLHPSPKVDLEVPNQIINTCLASLARVLCCAWKVKPAFKLQDYQNYLLNNDPNSSLDGFFAALAAYLKSSTARHNTIYFAWFILHHQQVPAVVWPHCTSLRGALVTALDGHRMQSATQGGDKVYNTTMQALLAAYSRVTFMQAPTLDGLEGGEEKEGDDGAPESTRRLLRNASTWTQPAFEVVCAWLRSCSSEPSTVEDDSSDVLAEAALDGSLSMLDALVRVAPDLDVVVVLGSRLWGCRHQTVDDATIAGSEWGPAGDIFDQCRRALETSKSRVAARAVALLLRLLASDTTDLQDMDVDDDASSSSSSARKSAAVRLFSLAVPHGDKGSTPLAKCLKEIWGRGWLRDYAACCRAFCDVLVTSQAKEYTRSLQPASTNSNTAAGGPTVFWHEERFLLRAVHGVLAYSATLTGDRSRAGAKPEVVVAVEVAGSCLGRLLGRPWPIGEHGANAAFDRKEGNESTAFAEALKLVQSASIEGLAPVLRRARVLSGARCLTAAVAGLSHLLAVPVTAPTPDLPSETPAMSFSTSSPASTLPAVRSRGLFGQQYATPPVESYYPDAATDGHLCQCVAALAESFVAVRVESDSDVTGTGAGAGARVAGAEEKSVIEELVCAWQIVVNAAVRSRLHLVAAYKAAEQRAAEQSGSNEESNSMELEADPESYGAKSKRQQALAPSVVLTQDQGCSVYASAQPAAVFASVSLTTHQHSRTGPTPASQARGAGGQYPNPPFTSPPRYPILESDDVHGRALIGIIARAYTRIWAEAWVGPMISSIAGEIVSDTDNSFSKMGVERELFLETLWWTMHRLSAYAVEPDQLEGADLKSPVSVKNGGSASPDGSLAATLIAALPGFDRRCLPSELTPPSASPPSTSLNSDRTLDDAGQSLSPPCHWTGDSTGTSGSSFYGQAPRLIWWALLPSLCHADMSSRVSSTSSDASSATKLEFAPTAILIRAILRSNNGITLSIGMAPLIISWMHSSLKCAPATMAASGEARCDFGDAGSNEDTGVAAFSAFVKRVEKEREGKDATPKPGTKPASVLCRMLYQPYVALSGDSTVGVGETPVKAQRGAMAKNDDQASSSVKSETKLEDALRTKTPIRPGSLFVLGALWRGLLHALHNLEGPASQEPVVSHLLRNLRMLVEIPCHVLVGAGGRGLRGWVDVVSSRDAVNVGSRTTISTTKSTTSSDNKSHNSSNGSGNSLAGTSAIYADVVALWLRQERNLVNASTTEGDPGSGDSSENDNEVNLLATCTSALGLGPPGPGLVLHCSSPHVMSSPPARHSSGATGGGGNLSEATSDFLASLSLLRTLAACLKGFEGGVPQSGQHHSTQVGAVDVIVRLLRPRLAALLCLIVGSGAGAAKDPHAEFDMRGEAALDLKAAVDATSSLLKDVAWGPIVAQLAAPPARSSSSLSSSSTSVELRGARVVLYSASASKDQFSSQSYREIHRGGCVETCLHLLFDAALGDKYSPPTSTRLRGIHATACLALVMDVAGRSDEYKQCAVVDKNSFVHILLDRLEAIKHSNSTAPSGRAVLALDGGSGSLMSINSLHSISSGISSHSGYAEVGPDVSNLHSVAEEVCKETCQGRCGRFCRDKEESAKKRPRAGSATSSSPLPVPVGISIGFGQALLAEKTGLKRTFLPAHGGNTGVIMSPPRPRDNTGGGSGARSSGAGSTSAKRARPHLQRLEVLDDRHFLHVQAPQAASNASQDLFQEQIKE